VEDIVSPCISVCRLSATAKLCEGCWRTRNEIAGWRHMSNDEKRAVLGLLHDRRDASGEGKKRPRRRTRRSQMAAQ